MSNRPITEDDLQAFVDNVLAPERYDEVANFLMSNPEIAARTMAYSKQASALRAALDPIAAEPVPSRLNVANIAAARRQAPRPGYIAMAAAAVVLLAVGATGGWVGRSLSSPPTEGIGALAQEASASYGAYAGDRVHPVEVRADGSDALRQFATATLGTAAAIPDLSSAGYRLMGGRVVPTPHGAGFMLMYDNDKGSRLVMLSRRMTSDRDKTMVATADGHLSGWSWSDNGMGYSLVGSIPAADLHPIADAMRSQI